MHATTRRDDSDACARLKKTSVVLILPSHRPRFTSCGNSFLIAAFCTRRLRRAVSPRPQFRHRRGGGGEVVSLSCGPQECPPSRVSTMSVAVRAHKTSIAGPCRLSDAVVNDSTLRSPRKCGCRSVMFSRRTECRSPQRIRRTYARYVVSPEPERIA